MSDYLLEGKDVTHLFDLPVWDIHSLYSVILEEAEGGLRPSWRYTVWILQGIDDGVCGQIPDVITLVVFVHVLLHVEPNQCSALVGSYGWNGCSAPEEAYELLVGQGLFVIAQEMSQDTRHQ